jgi:hypothetical protein
MCRIMVVCKNNGRKIVVFSQRKCGSMSGDRQFMCRLIVVLKKKNGRSSAEKEIGGVCFYPTKREAKKKASVKVTNDCRKMEW